MKEAKDVQEVFSRQQTVPVCSFWKELTTEVDLREACTMVFNSNPASDLLLMSHAI